MRKNPFRKLFTYGVIVIFVCIIMVFLLFKNAINRFEEADAIINKVIGTQIILNGDTLLVIDYNLWKNHYILNDGTQISTKLLDDLEVLP